MCRFSRLVGISIFCPFTMVYFLDYGCLCHTNIWRLLISKNNKLLPQSLEARMVL